MRRLRKILQFILSVSAIGAVILYFGSPSVAGWPATLSAIWAAIVRFVSQDSTTALAIAGSILASAGHAFIRRSKPVREAIGVYFDKKELLDPPLNRPGYSDRMAYLMGEFAGLAYYVIEPAESDVERLIEASSVLDLKDASQLKRFLKIYDRQVRPSRLIRLGPLRSTLAKAGFEYVDHLNYGSTQGFVSVRKSKPLIVVAFRGTEQEIEDWLTDVDAIPTVLGQPDEDHIERVHTGFYNAFESVKDSLVKAIDEARGRLGAAGKDAPVYFTGHSLGGALAQIAMHDLAPDSYGACYTFGSPRVANYNYFSTVKTPHYRVVNSSDIVPRVPPGAGMVVVSALLRLLSFAATKFPVVKEAIESASAVVDRMKYYRHFGDQRYLTDVQSGRWHDTRLLSNPPLLDETLWFWRRLAYSLSSPVKSHSVVIYREKLTAIAERRLA